MQFSVSGLSFVAAMSIGTCLAPHPTVHSSIPQLPKSQFQHF